MDQQVQWAQEEAYAVQARAAQLTAMAVQASAQVTATHSLRAPDGEATMRYTEHEFNVGSVEVERHGETFTYPIPEKFGMALSLVAEIEARQNHPKGYGGAYLWCALASSLDGEHWAPLVPIGATDAHRLLSADYMVGQLRLHGPFTDRLALTCFIRESNKFGSQNLRGLWTGVVLRLGVQWAQ